MNISIGKNDTIIDFETLGHVKISNSDTNIATFISWCEQQKPAIALPTDAGQPVFTVPEKCPLDSSLTPKVYYMDFQKTDVSFRMDILVAHFDSNGNRVSRYDSLDTIIADMSEERRVEISEGIYEYSFVLANSFIAQGMSIPQLISMSSQIWYSDGSWKRIYPIQ